MKHLAHYLLFLLVFLWCSGFYKNNIGYRFDEKSLERIEEGKTTKDELITILGTPTFSLEPHNRTLFYAGQVGWSILFINNLPISQRIVAYHLNEADVVDFKKEYNLSSLDSGNMQKIVTDLPKPNKLWALPVYKLI